ncbi:folylpolyglutamate synthase/dihydrofolate synthase family protein [Bacillota bacterium]
MNYKETIEKIHDFQKFGSRLGLERMSVLMDLLGNPQEGMKVIHVAGTNGKGSVCRYLASVLQENGYKTGLYTSPYLERFTERIEFDGREISEDDLTGCAGEVFEAVDRMVAEGYESPTEFELITAIGFIYFSRRPMDILILEVGLGGRGDSTNIIKTPLAAVITSISHDHMNVLGDTLPEIAFEKAGIIKAGCRVISNVEDSEAAEVIRQTAERLHCGFYDASLVKPEQIEKSLEGYSFTIRRQKESLRVELGMIGMHQISNAVCALSVVEDLEKMGIISCQKEKVLRGFKNAFQKGRLEVVKKDPWVLLDGAHNIAGIEAFNRVVKDHFDGARLLIVIGMLADKEIGPMVSRLCRLKGDFIASEPDSPRKLDAETLCAAVKSEGCSCVAIADPDEAYKHILAEMLKYDAVFITGSLYLIGRMRGLFNPMRGG